MANHPAVRVDDGETNLLDEILASAEQRFVRNDFKQALHLANQVLLQDAHNSITTSRSTISTISTNEIINTTISSKSSSHLPLQTEVPYLDDKTYQFVLALESNVSRADRAAAIMLQCHHQTPTPEPLSASFLNYYATHAMPLDLFSIFIPFVMQQQQQQEDSNQEVPTLILILELAIEALCQLRLKNHCINNEVGIQEATDELVWTILTRMLPFYPNDVYVRRILTGKSWSEASSTTTTKSSNNQQEWHAEPVPSIVEHLPRVIDSLTGVASQECLIRCREQVQEMKGADSNSSSNNSKNNSANLLESIERTDDKQLQKPPIGQHQRQLPHRIDRFNWLETINRKDWCRALSKKLLCLVKERIMEPLFHADDRSQKRREVAMTIFSLYVAWKQRRRLLGAAGVVTAMILIPLKELAESVSFLAE